MRAATEVYLDDERNPTVDIVSEEHWYRWMFTHQPPVRVAYPLHHVWVE
jgi:hypothetical protein